MRKLYTKDEVKKAERFLYELGVQAEGNVICVRGHFQREQLYSQFYRLDDYLLEQGELFREYCHSRDELDKQEYPAGPEYWQAKNEHIRKYSEIRNVYNQWKVIAKQLGIPVD